LGSENSSGNWIGVVPPILELGEFMRKLALLTLGVGSLVLGASVDAAVLQTQNSVVVLRVGDGASGQGGVGAVFLEEYSITYTGTVPTGATHVQTIAVPAAGATGTRLTIGNTAAAEGGMNFSANGQYLMFGGYDSNVNATGSTGNARRMIGRVDLSGNVSIDAIYGAGTTSSNNAIRGVTSLTGNEYWFAMSANPGIAHRTWEGGNNAGVAATSLAVLNSRRLEIFNNQLYVSSASGTNQGVSTVGTGVPTTTGQTVTILPGMPTTAGPSPYDFFFADANTVYVADDRQTTSGGLQKWVLESGTWVLKYTKNIDTTNDSIDNGLRGLTGAVDAFGNVTLFATSTYGTTGTANFLVGIADTLANTDPNAVQYNSLASAASIPGALGPAANFRGLEAIGILVPEPATIGLLAGGAMLLGARRRR
jgi:hypothetical protein